MLTPHDVEPDYDYESVRLLPDITDNELDLLKRHDIEDAYIAFEDNLPGGRDLETIGKVNDFISQSLKDRWPEEVEGGRTEPRNLLWYMLSARTTTILAFFCW